MKTPCFLATALCLAVSIPATEAEVVVPKRNFFSNSVGLLKWSRGSTFFRGSGVVAWDTRLVFSCAHVIHDNGLWAGEGVTFYPGYHSQSQPSGNTSGVPLRSYRFFSNYSSKVATHGKESSEAYDLDFVIFHSTSVVADAFGCWHEGGPQLASNKWKLIAGYPSHLHFTGADGGFWQHSTDFFTHRAEKWHGSYHDFRNVTTGPGNSGGPVFVYEGDTPNLAGILVSGDSQSVGVRALDSDTKSMVEQLLGPQTKTQTFRNSSAFNLPDGSTRFSTRPVRVSGFSSRVETLRFSLNMTTSFRGDLEVYLKSPSGRIRWVSKRKGGAAKNLMVNNADYTKDFRGFAANGTWTLHLRDAVKGDRAAFKSMTLNITAP